MALESSKQSLDVPANHESSHIQKLWSSVVATNHLHEETETSLKKADVQKSHHTQACFVTKLRSPDSPAASLSELPTIPQQFMDIALGDYVGCQTFLKLHPDMLREKHTDLLLHAKSALEVNDDDLARRCIQQAIVLRDCAGRALQQNVKYFEDLIENDSELLEGIEYALARLWQKIRALSGTAHQSAEEKQREELEAAVKRQRATRAELESRRARLDRREAALEEAKEKQRQKERENEEKLLKRQDSLSKREALHFEEEKTFLKKERELAEREQGLLEQEKKLSLWQIELSEKQRALEGRDETLPPKRELINTRVAEINLKY